MGAKAEAKPKAPEQRRVRKKGQRRPHLSDAVPHTTLPVHEVITVRLILGADWERGG